MCINFRFAWFHIEEHLHVLLIYTYICLVLHGISSVSSLILDFIWLKSDWLRFHCRANNAFQISWRLKRLPEELSSSGVLSHQILIDVITWSSHIYFPSKHAVTWAEQVNRGCCWDLPYVSGWHWQKSVLRWGVVTFIVPPLNQYCIHQGERLSQNPSLLSSSYGKPLCR